MKAKTKTKMGRLGARQVLDAPLKEVSGICLRRGPGGAMALVAVGDRESKVAWAAMSSIDAGSPDWRTLDISQVPGSGLPEKDAQIEAICADGAGRVLLVQETPPRAELVDPAAHQVTASLQLVIDGDDKLARSWSDPKGSRAEGAVLLPAGRLLVAKEKDPAALIEFGPSGADSQGLARGGALADGAAWPVELGDHRLVALAVWRADKTLSKVCEDFSDLEIGPDGRLYLLSDQSAVIARLGDLPPGGGEASLAAWWKLDDLDAKPEGLAFTASGCAVVALDKRKTRNNLVVLEPAISINSSDFESEGF
jgi:hypothetical protein